MAYLGAAAGGVQGAQGLWEAPSTLLSGGKPSEFDDKQQALARFLQQKAGVGLDLPPENTPTAPAGSSAELAKQQSMMDFTSLIQRPQEQQGYMAAPTTQPGQPQAVYQQVPGPSPQRYLSTMMTPFGQQAELLRRYNPTEDFRNRYGGVLAMMGF